MVQRLVHNTNGIRFPLFIHVCCFFLLLLTPSVVHAVLPKLALDIQIGGGGSSSEGGDKNEEGVVLQTFLLSHAFFGPEPTMKNEQQNEIAYTITFPPEESNFWLCENVTYTQVLPKNSLLLVPRGACTFERKSYNAQQLGASAIIIYGNLASRYTLNTTKTDDNDDDQRHKSNTVQDIIYPLSKYDYDCEKGSTYVPASDIVLDDPLPYNPSINDPILTKACDSADNNNMPNCASGTCLLTGNKTTKTTGSNNKEMIQACCAWDLHIWLYPDNAMVETNNNKEDTTIRIPAAYMTAGQFHELSVLLSGRSNNNKQERIYAKLYARWRPKQNFSAILIWLLGCFVAAIASYVSAGDYHIKMQQIWKKRRQRRQQQDPNGSQQTRRESSARPPRHHHRPQDEILELDATHAAAFVVMASTSLLVLFYFKIYSVVKVFYAFGCSTAVTQVILYPLLRYCTKGWWGIKDKVVWRTEDFGDITVREIVAHVLGYSLGLAWLVVAFVHRDAENMPFFWIMQDVFGACMCIVFLKVIRLNSIRVASILLIVAFFYDIFFVFITPYLFQGKSVMITVATSGGPPKADALWCEKYPDDKDCQGGNPLPMLLAIPKLFDFAGGSSLLGLGDIVLPGLLLSFAARLDAAKALLGVLAGGTNNQTFSHCPEQECCCSGSKSTCVMMICRGGYFAPLVVAYAVGLAMANMAVYLMQMGQPALLYLVPCCLGTMTYIGWRRKELQQLWDGPRVLKAADDVLFGTQQQQQDQQHAPVPVEEDGDALAAPPPSAIDDNDDDEAVGGDLPLLEQASGT